jgi:hypothetical protein
MMNPLQKLLDFLIELDNRKISYQLSNPRDYAIMVEVAVPGERWEAEFFADGHVEVEIFRSVDGIIGGEEALLDLLTRHSD